MSNQLPTVNELAAEKVVRFMPSSELRLKGPILLGVLTLSLFLGGLGYWAATSKLESAAIAYGDLSVLSKRQEIQHLEGALLISSTFKKATWLKKGNYLFSSRSVKLTLSWTLLAVSTSTLSQKKIVSTQSWMSFQRLFGRKI